MISGRDIIYISSIEWNFLWQGHQEIALRLAAAGNRVLYVENMGVRSPGLRDAGRVALRLKRWARALVSQGVREVAPNIYVCSPVVLPPFGSRLRRELNRRFFLPSVRRAARRLGMRDPLIWAYLPTDTTLDLVRLFRNPRSAVVYYCVADFPQLTPHAEELRESERELVTLSSVVFTNCSELTQKFSEWNPNSHVFPFGVNLDAFQQASGDAPSHGDHRDPAHAVPASLDNLPKPIIGYVGGMHKHVDFEMLKEMARARPQWSWVCVGALQAATGELSGLPNVHLLGQQPHNLLAHFMQHFDVCIVPYVNSVYTATVVPTKINEYLAMGKPVVSTNLPTVCEFNEEHGVLITSAPETGDFLRAIEQALALPRDAATVAHRRWVASLGDWQPRFDAMISHIEAQLGAKND